MKSRSFIPSIAAATVIGLVSSFALSLTSVLQQGLLGAFGGALALVRN